MVSHADNAERELAVDSRSELTRLVRLALPIVFTQMTQMGMSVADAIMAGRVSPTDMAGVALGGSFFWACLLLASGTIMALTPTVSQLHGAGRTREIGRDARQALWLAVILGALVMLAMNNVEPLYELVSIDPAAIPVAVAYLDALAWGAIPLLGYFALRYLCEGMSWTTPAMIIAVGALVLKVPLNALFIYGNDTLGVPAMGGVGCGWSTAIVMTAECVAMLIVVGVSRIRASGLYERFDWPNPAILLRLLKLGLPIGLSLFLEISVFAAVTLLVGTLGVNAVAAHQIGSNFGGVMFMVPMAIGMAGSIRVGFNVGAGHLAAARHAAFLACAVAVAIALLLSIGLYFVRDLIASMYTLDAEVRNLGARILVFVAAFQLVDALQVAAIGALRGYKDTFVSMLIALVAYWFVGLPVGAVLGLGLLGAPALGLDGFWLGLTAGLAVAAVLLGFRLRWLSGAFARIGRSVAEDRGSTVGTDA